MNSDALGMELYEVGVALERQGLTPEQLDRGWKRYNELWNQFIVARAEEKAREAQVKIIQTVKEPVTPEKQIPQRPIPDDVARNMAKIREILGEKR